MDIFIDIYCNNCLSDVYFRCNLSRLSYTFWIIFRSILNCRKGFNLLSQSFLLYRSNIFSSIYKLQTTNYTTLKYNLLWILFVVSHRQVSYFTGISNFWHARWLRSNETAASERACRRGLYNAWCDWKCRTVSTWLAVSG